MPGSSCIPADIEKCVLGENFAVAPLCRSESTAPPRRVSIIRPIAEFMQVFVAFRENTVGPGQRVNSNYFNPSWTAR